MCTQDTIVPAGWGHVNLDCGAGSTVVITFAQDSFVESSRRIAQSTLRILRSQISNFVDAPAWESAVPMFTTAYSRQAERIWRVSR
jgi:hypothetical protein